MICGSDNNMHTVVYSNPNHQDHFYASIPGPGKRDGLLVSLVAEVAMHGSLLKDSVFGHGGSFRSDSPNDTRSLGSFDFPSTSQGVNRKVPGKERYWTPTR